MGSDPGQILRHLGEGEKQGEGATIDGHKQNGWQNLASVTHLSINSKKSFPGATNSPRHNSHQGPSKVLTVLQHTFEVTQLLVRFCHECSKWVGEPDHQIAHTTHETTFQRR